LGHDTCQGKCIPSIRSLSICKGKLVPDTCGSPDLVCCLQLDRGAITNRPRTMIGLSTIPGTQMEPALNSIRKRPPRDTYFSLLRSVVAEAFKSPQATDKKILHLKEDSEMLVSPITNASTVLVRESTDKQGGIPFTPNISTASTPGLNSAPGVELKHQAPATKATEGGEYHRTTPKMDFNSQRNKTATTTSKFLLSDQPTTILQLESTTPATPEPTTEYLSYPCPGSCVASFLAWFCDLQSSDYQCPNDRVCCMPLTTTTTELPPIGPCSGTCLHPLLTGLCRRPARLLLKTTTCDSQSICCTETPRIW
ncbi:unnamed protein product, partial [Ixodes hexagonus]